MKNIFFAVNRCLGAVAAILLSVWCFNVSAATTTVPINSLSMTVGQSQINFPGNMKAIIEKRDNGVTRITIGVEDKVQRAELLIQADIPSWDGQNPKYIQTQTDSLMFMLKHENGSVFIIPSIQFAKDSGKKYVQRVRKAGKATNFSKASPDWVRMSKSERLATGRGIIRNQGMEGSSFFVMIQPVVENGHVKKITGTFSGVASMGQNRFQKGEFVNIMDGQFNIEVRQNAIIK
ncbi:conserved hypothetical protein, secreted [Candidatus Magnetomorum sp. HK-1]|nr:conserved hypothetical protein, secreted [Candidatus Magnetomorum sp. HK-1]